MPSYYQYVLGDKTLITILKILPLNKNLKEEILDKIIYNLLANYFLQELRFPNFSQTDDDWDLDIEGYLYDY